MIDEKTTYKQAPELFKLILKSFDFTPGESATPLNYFWDSEGEGIIIKDHYTIPVLCNAVQSYYFKAGKNYGRALLQQEFRNLLNIK